MSNAWYMAAWAAESSDGLSSRRILDERIVNLSHARYGAQVRQMHGRAAHAAAHRSAEQEALEAPDT